MREVNKGGEMKCVKGKRGKRHSFYLLVLGSAIIGMMLVGIITNNGFPADRLGMGDAIKDVAGSSCCGQNDTLTENEEQSSSGLYVPAVGNGCTTCNSTDSSGTVTNEEDERPMVISYIPGGNYANRYVTVYVKGYRSYDECECCEDIDDIDPGTRADVYWKWRVNGDEYSSSTYDNTDEQIFDTARSRTWNVGSKDTISVSIQLWDEDGGEQGGGDDEKFDISKVSDDLNLNYNLLNNTFWGERYYIEPSGSTTGPPNWPWMAGYLDHCDPPPDGGTCCDHCECFAGFDALIWFDITDDYVRPKLTQWGTGNFGQCNVTGSPPGYGTVKTRSFTFTNWPAATDDAIIDLSLTGSNASEFFIIGGTHRVIAPDVTETVEVQFKPRSSGYKTATLGVSTTHPCLPEAGYSIHLSGTGVYVRQANIEPSSWDIGTVRQDACPFKTFWINNTGSGTCYVNVNLSNIFNYTVLPSGDVKELGLVTLNFSVAPNYSITRESKTIVIKYTPTGPGTHICNLTISDTGPSDSATLTGAVADVKWEPIPSCDFDFGKLNVSAGESKTQTFLLKNLGGGTATGTVGDLTGPDASEFSIIGGKGPFSVTSISSHMVSVQFCPSGAYNYTAYLNATGTNCNNASALLTGKGTLPPTAYIKIPSFWGPDFPVPLDGTVSHDNDEGNWYIKQYDWNFGEGTGWHINISGKPNPLYTLPDGFHSYNYTIHLKVTDNEDDTDRYSTNVTIKRGPVPPYANAGGPYWKMVNEIIVFNASKSLDPDTNGSGITTYMWRFFQDYSWHEHTLPTATHIYTEEGVYEVTLMVVDNEGDSNMDTIQVAVDGYRPPVADIAAPYGGYVNKETSFDGSGSYDPDQYMINSSGFGIVNWTWDFGDGTMGYDESVDHVYTVAQTYTVTLTVTDNEYETASATVTVSIGTYEPPTAVITPRVQMGAPGVPVFFDGRLSCDNDEEGFCITQYDWNFGDDTGWYNNITATPAHTYYEIRDYIVTLRVHDDEGQTGTTTGRVKVLPFAPPTSDPNGPYIGLEYCTVTLDASGSHDNDEGGVTIMEYHWYFGDGTEEHYTGGVTVGRTVNHTYLNDGTYIVNLTVVDNEAKTDTGTTTMTILNNPPIAIPKARRAGNTRVFEFDATDSIDTRPGHSAHDLTYRWDFNNDGVWDKIGNYSQVGKVTWPYTHSGPTTVVLEVWNEKDGVSRSHLRVLPYLPSEITTGCSNPDFFLSYPGSGLSKQRNKYWVRAPKDWLDAVEFVVNNEGEPIPGISHRLLGGGYEEWSILVDMSDLIPGDHIVINGYSGADMWRRPCDFDRYPHRHLLWTHDYEAKSVITPTWFVNFLKDFCWVDIDHASDYSSWEMTITPYSLGLTFGVAGVPVEMIGGGYGLDASVNTPDTFTISSTDDITISNTLVSASFSVGIDSGGTDLGDDYKTYEDRKTKKKLKTDFSFYFNIGASLSVDLEINEREVYLVGTITVSGNCGVEFQIPCLTAFGIPTWLVDAGISGGIEAGISVTTDIARMTDDGMSFSPGRNTEVTLSLGAEAGLYLDVLGGLGGVEGGIYADGGVTFAIPSGDTTITLEGGIYAEAYALWGLWSDRWEVPIIVKEWPESAQQSLVQTLTMPLGDRGADSNSTVGRTVTMHTMDLLCLKPDPRSGGPLPLTHAASLTYPISLAGNVVVTAAPKIAALSSGEALAAWTDIHLVVDTVFSRSWIQSDVWWSIYDGSTWSTPQSTDTTAICEFDSELTVITDDHGVEHIMMTYVQVNSTVMSYSTVDDFYTHPFIHTAVWNRSAGWSFKGQNITTPSGSVNAMALTTVNDTVYMTYLIDSDADPRVQGIGRIYMVNGSLHDGRITWGTPVLLRTLVDDFLSYSWSPDVAFMNDSHGGICYLRWNTIAERYELIFMGTTSGISGPLFTTHLIRQTNLSITDISAEAFNTSIIFTWVENQSCIHQNTIVYNELLGEWNTGADEMIYAGDAQAIVFAKMLANETTRFLLFQMGDGFVPYVIEQLPNGSWGKLRQISISGSYVNGQLDGSVAGNHSHMTYLKSTPITTWLVGNWRFNEGTGYTAVDTSGHGNDGVLKDVLYWKAHTGTNGDLQPSYDYCLGFLPNNSGSVEIPYDSSLDVTDEFTLCFWMKNHGSGDPVTIMGKEGSWVLQENHGTLSIILHTDNPSGSITKEIAPLPMATWTFVSVIFNDGRLNVTLRPIGSADISTEFLLGDISITHTTAPLTIGSGFYGYIDEIWLFNRDISMNKVDSIWFTPYPLLGNIHEVMAQPLPPYATFTYSISSTGSLSTVALDSSISVTTEDTLIFTGSPSMFIFAWDFGDGTTDTGTNVNHKYAASGWHTVICNATDPSNSVTIPITKIIHVTDATSPVFAGLTHATSGYCSVNLSWNPASDTSPFVIYYLYMKKEGEPFNFSSPRLTTLNTFYNVTGLTAGITYDFLVRAVDAYGNTDTNMENKSATPYDHTPPEFIGLDLAAAVGNAVGTVMLSWSPATDSSLPINYTIYMSTGPHDLFNPINSIATTSETYYIVGNLGNHKYWFGVRATDKWGNTDTNIEMRSAVPNSDITPPATIRVVGTPNYGPNDEWVTSYTPIAFNASDDILGVSTTWYRIWYSGTWTPWMHYTGAFTLWGECVHYIEYYSVDNGGNVERVQNATQHVDNTPPVSWHTPEWIPMQHPNPGAVITIHAKDEGICSVGGYSILYGIWGTDIHGHVDNKSAVFSVPDIEGSYRLIYWVVDMLGNSEKHHRIDFRVMLENTVYKTLSFSGDYEWAETHWMITPDTEICFDPEAAEVVEIYWRIDSGNWSKYTECFTVPIGLHSIYCYGIDEGNRRQTVAHFIVEAVSTLTPTTTCTLSPFLPDGSNGWYTNDITITLTAFDEISGVDSTYYRLDEGRWIVYSHPIRVTDDGEHTLRYYSVDKAGIKEEEKSTMFKIDKTSPTVAFEQPTYGYLYLLGKEILPLRRTVIIGKTMVAVTAIDATSGISRVVFYVDDELKQDVSGEPFEWLWDEFTIGRHTLKVVVYDTAGNIATDEQEVWIFNLGNTQKNIARYNDNLYRNLKTDEMYGVPGFEAILLLGVIITAVVLEKKRKPKR